MMPTSSDEVHTSIHLGVPDIHCQRKTGASAALQIARPRRSGTAAPRSPNTLEYACTQSLYLKKLSFATCGDLLVPTHSLIGAFTR